MRMRIDITSSSGFRGWWIRVLMVGSLCILASSTLALPQSKSDLPDGGSKEAEEYRIGSEDLLQLQVWGRPDLSGNIEVGYRGAVQLPIVGRVQAAGRTPGELSEDLTERFRLFDPKITDVIVTVTQYNALRVSVVGEVRSPGSYGFREIPDVWGAILAAGGATPSADLERVQVVHKDLQQGEDRTTTVDLSDGIEEIEPARLPELRSKDTIIVPFLEDEVSPEDKFNVLGAVRAPGLYRVEAAESMIEALALSGGPLENADLGRVRLTRPTRDGAVSYELDLDGYLRSGRPRVDLELRAGDTVLVPSKDSVFQRTLSAVLRVVPLVTVTSSLVVALNR